MRQEKYLAWDNKCKTWINPSSILFVQLTRDEINDIEDDEDKTIHDPETLDKLDLRNIFYVEEDGMFKAIRYHKHTPLKDY